MEYTKLTVVALFLISVVVAEYQFEEKLADIDFQLKTLVLSKEPRNCKELQERGVMHSGIYRINTIFDQHPWVYCNMDTHEGGWTYILNRFDGSYNFAMDYHTFQDGFGVIEGEHWLGLNLIHQLTAYEPTELLIELMDWDNQTVYAHYDAFSIGNGKEEYAIKSLGKYNGTAGDSLTYHAGMKFETWDHHETQCVIRGGFVLGGWWFRACSSSLLTGLYMKDSVEAQYKSVVMFWGGFHGVQYSLKEARMMVRPLKQVKSSAGCSGS